jgi:hypothetical protein
VSLEDDLREWARSARDAAAADVVEQMRRDAPVGTGGLLDSIRDPEPLEDAGSVGAVVGADADYAEWTDLRGEHAGWYSDAVDAWEQYLDYAAQGT